MKLLLLFAVFALVTVLNAHRHEAGYDDERMEVERKVDRARPDKPYFPGGEDDDEDADDDDDEDNNEDNDEDDDNNEDEDDDEDEVVENNPTTEFPRKGRWAGFECIVSFKKCLMRSRSCEDQLACFQEKTICIKDVKKRKEGLRFHKFKSNCTVAFENCSAENAQNGCQSKLMCYQKKKECWQSTMSEKRRHHRHHHRPRHHGGHRRHHRRPHHRRRPCPKMMKCVVEMKKCIEEAGDNCTMRLACLNQMYDCSGRARPTKKVDAAFKERGGEEDDNDEVQRRRKWDPARLVKCREDLKICLGNVTQCPEKLNCFKLMKKCMFPHGGPGRMKFKGIINHMYNKGKQMVKKWGKWRGLQGMGKRFTGRWNRKSGGERKTRRGGFFDKFRQG